MGNFKRKNKTHRAQIKKLDPCDNWTTPKSIQRVTAENKSVKSFIEKYTDILTPVLKRLKDK